MPSGLHNDYADGGWLTSVGFGAMFTSFKFQVAVLQALGLTRWQSRGVVVTQASVLAAIGLLFGIPLGLALGRTVWRVVAENTPLLYVAPVAVATLVLIVPLALLSAAPLGQRAARGCASAMRCGRSERGRRGCQLRRSEGC